VRLHLATLLDDYRRHGSQRAVVLYRGNRRQVSTYGELANLAERFAAELIRRQIVLGDRVVLWGQNSAEWIAAFFGCVLRGVLVVPLDATGGLDFAQRVIVETQPRLVVGDRSLLSRLNSNSEAPGIVLEELSATLPIPPFQASLLEPAVGPDTPLQILFTSGTTSEPKGIVHTHRNVLASLEPIEREMQKYLRYERPFHPLRFLHTLPLSHVFGQFMGLWIPPLLAAELHFETRLQAPRLLELIRRQRISVLAAVPRVLNLLQSELESRIRDLPTRLEASHGLRIWSRWWRFRDVHREFGFKFWAFVCGGASLPPQLERFWSDLGFALIQGYGMTETAALITLNHPFHIAQGTIGKPLPGREIRIGTDGEILVRGEMVASARWQNGRMQTLPDPWLATGDLAEQNGEGQLHFLGRKSETIVTAAGLNIHPEDVEAALNRQPGVQASAVVPLETPEGSLPVAVLLFRGSSQQAQSAINEANSSLAEYQRVHHWKLWPQLDLPRTAIGKIQRRKITEWVAAQSVVAQSVATQRPERPAPDSQSDDPLSSLIAGINGTRHGHFADDARLDRELNLDSLARVQLQSELEQRLGVTISDEEFERIATFGQLRARLGFEPQASASGEPSVGSCPPPSRSGVPGNEAGQMHLQSADSAGESSRFIYPHWTWSPAVQALRVIFQEAVMRPLVWLLAAPSVRSPRPRHNQPLLLIANHVTAFDAPLVLYALPSAMRRRVAIAMSGEMLEDFRHGRNQGHWFLNLLAPVAYWLITTLFNVFPLPRGAGFRRSFAYAGEAMDRGYHVLVFPEGHRSADGALQPFRPGIALLARESGAAILPVALKGLGELKQRNRRWFRSGKLQIRVGEPLLPNLQLAPEDLAQSLHNALAALLDS
jgi:long-chain acyl-CoA synthetase